MGADAGRTISQTVLTLIQTGLFIACLFGAYRMVMHLELGRLLGPITLVGRLGIVLIAAYLLYLPLSMVVGKLLVFLNLSPSYGILYFIAQFVEGLVLVAALAIILRTLVAMRG